MYISNINGHMTHFTHPRRKSKKKFVLTSTCQATRPLQGGVGVQLMGNLVAVCADVMQHALGGGQGGVAAHH